MRALAVGFLLLTITVARAESPVVAYEGANTTRDIWARQAILDGYGDLSDKQLGCMAQAVMAPAPTAANQAAQALAEQHTEPALEAFLRTKADYFAAFKAEKGRDPFDYMKIICTHS